MPRARCVECGKEFEFRRKTQIDATRGGDEPAICGRLPCRMRHDYTDEDWEGRARMARAKQAAESTPTPAGYLDDYDSATRPFTSRRFVPGPVELDGIDEEALRRCN